MKFCEDCGNILLPKKKLLYCKVCDKTFPLKEKKAYKSGSQDIGKKSKLKKKLALRTSVIIEDVRKTPSISQDERDAFGELLEMSGE